MNQKEFDELYRKLHSDEKDHTLEWCGKVRELNGIEVTDNNPHGVIQRLLGVLESFGCTVLDNPMWEGTSEYGLVIIKPVDKR